MKNNLIFYLVFSFLQFFNFANVFADVDFKFNIREIEIVKKEIYIKVSKRTVSSGNQIVINADEFEYKKYK